MITPGCTGPDGLPLALAATDDGTIVVADATRPTSACWWSLIYDNASQNFAMVSILSTEQGTPSVLALANSGGGTSSLQLTPLSKGLNALSTWDVAPGGSALAVRPTLSTSLNLNVEGVGPYPPGTPVIAYAGWSNGQPNEIWTFQQTFGDEYPWWYTFSPECAPAMYLSANPLDPGAQLTIQPMAGAPKDAQLWAGMYNIDGISPLGVLFINAELSQMVRTTPGGGAVFCVDSGTPDQWSAWLEGPGPDEGMSAVRSVGDQNLYWNVSGGACNAGDPVITYPWQGGAQNEQWRMTSMPGVVTQARVRLRT